MGKGNPESADAIIARDTVANDEGISVWNLKDEMTKSGYTDIATSVGIMTLTKSGMIETFKAADYNGNEYISSKITEKGENWILTNQDQLQFRKQPKIQEKIVDDLPF
jgi:hypothetical protein